MKRTARQKNSIIISFISTIIVFFIWVYLLIFNIYPSIISIELIKDETSQTQKKINEFNKNWLSYKDFIWLKWELDINNDKDSINFVYLSKLFEKVDEDFYEKYFKNDTKKSYEDFLSQRKIELEEKRKENSTWIWDKLKRVLPNYSSNSVIIDKDHDVLTDYIFISFLENFFKNFNIEYSWDLSINQIESLEKWSEDLETSLFYIPYTFSITWTKRDVINFIRYFENVWSIKTNWNDLDLYNDKIIFDKFGNEIYIWNDINYADYNIFNNQFADIESVIFNSYIDSSEVTRKKWIWLIAFIMNDSQQSEEEIKAEISVRFYTIWAQNYKIKEYVNIVLANYDWFIAALSKEVKKPELVNSKETSKIVKLRKMIKILETIKEFTAEVNNLKKQIAKNENLNEAYRAAQKYEEMIDRYIWIVWSWIYTKK